MASHPLAEVFGFPADNLSAAAERYRRNKLCPFNNKVPSEKLDNQYPPDAPTLTDVIINE